MRSLVPSLVLFLGACLACTGLWWVWTGLEIVQVERGWTSVIAGSTMLSAGLVIAALSAVLVRLGDISDALAETSVVPVPAQDTAATALAPVAPEKVSPPQASQHDEASSDDDRTEVGRHVTGDATYVMFADGTVDALTPEGTMTFPSLEALRVYADEREAEDERSNSRRS